ncbi:MAG: DUF4920 domain-containing protein [Leeuwenhoekiella sp.]
MKTVLSSLCLLLILTACKTEKNDKESPDPVAKEEIALTENPEVYGLAFTNETVLTAAEMGEIYASLQPGDTVPATFKGKVDKVCKAKGCWMQMDVGSPELAMVKFKDYGFFVPTDIDGEEVVVNGKAFISEVSVDEQKHYAEDEGQTPEEIAAITEPKKTLSFTATGVKQTDE